MRSFTLALAITGPPKRTSSGAGKSPTLYVMTFSGLMDSSRRLAKADEAGRWPARGGDTNIGTRQSPPGYGWLPQNTPAPGEQARRSRDDKGRHGGWRGLEGRIRNDRSGWRFSAVVYSWSLLRGQDRICGGAPARGAPHTFDRDGQPSRRAPEGSRCERGRSCQAGRPLLGRRPCSTSPLLLR
jgi:hypothetical protein